MEELILSLRDVHKTFGTTEALTGVSLDVQAGEFLTLLGPSGCGKTTTLRIIAGLEAPDGGRVLLQGSDVTDWEPNRRNVNTVFQSYALFPHMNVARNIGYGLRLKRRQRMKSAAASTRCFRLCSFRATARVCRRSFQAASASA